MMSLTGQKRAASGVSVEVTAPPDVGRAEDLDVRGLVQHREIRADVGHVEVGRPPGCLCPVDQPGDGVALPQHVSKVEVTVQQALWRRRRTVPHRPIACRHRPGHRAHSGTSGTVDPLNEKVGGR